MYYFTVHTMSITVNGIQQFGTAVMQLPSFPVLIIYIIMVMTAGLWQKVTKPLSLRPVCIQNSVLSYSHRSEEFMIA